MDVWHDSWICHVPHPFECWILHTPEWVMSHTHLDASCHTHIQMRRLRQLSAPHIHIENIFWEHILRTYSENIFSEHILSSTYSEKNIYTQQNSKQILKRTLPILKRALHDCDTHPNAQTAATLDPTYPEKKKHILRTYSYWEHILRTYSELHISWKELYSHSTKLYIYSLKTLY